MIFYVFIFLLLLTLESIYLFLANRYKIVDKPNERSSHSSSIIRGGGIVFIAGFLLFSFTNDIAYSWLLLGVILSGLISFVDDLKGTPNKLRIGVHVISIGLLLYQSNLLLATWWILPLFIVLIGIMNAYNFMDGINGITGFYSLAVLIPFLWIEDDALMKDFIWITIISLLVFLFFNARKKARCFAGDIGSISMALMVMFVILQQIVKTDEYFLVFTILLYGIDSIFTIVQRLYNRENIFEAHRKHLYQYFVNEYKLPHLWVSGIYGILQLGFNSWLLLMMPSMIAVISVVLVTGFGYIGLKVYLIKGIRLINS